MEECRKVLEVGLIASQTYRKKELEQLFFINAVKQIPLNKFHIQHNFELFSSFPTFFIM